MKSHLRSIHGVMLVAVASLVVAGCAHTEVPQPKSSESAEAPTSTTTITSTAPMPAQPATADVHVSDDLMRACHLHFSDISQAPKFDFDQSNLKPSDSTVLSQIATCVTTGPLAGRGLRLVGRADPRGETEYNFALGEHRAVSVEQYLNALGVDANRIQATSRGKLDAVGTDPATWQVDRRVDIELQ
jgi:peptidoglycan-associated lipoprotein